MKNIKAVLWDFDGVIVDSLEIMEECWKEVQFKLNLEDIPFTEYKKQIGRPFLEVMKILGLSKDLSQKAKEIYFSSKARNNLPKLYQGIKETLEDLKKDNYKLALITSKDERTTYRWVREMGLEGLFEDIQTPDNLPKEFGKPNPYYILKSLINMGVTPDNSLYVGDMGVDLEASKRAGVSFFFATWGYGNIKNLDCQTKLNFPEEIKKYLK